MSRRRHRKEDGETSYWLSYSDMMAGLLLVFVLIISFTMLQAKKNAEAEIAKYEELTIKAEKAEKDAQDAKKTAEETQKKNDELQAKVDKVLGVGDNIKADLKKELASLPGVQVDDQSGTISLDSEILFAYDDDQLSQEGKEVLKSFLPGYFRLLLSSKYKDNIAEIIIEGHTDTDGDYLYNLDLSQRRALSVAKYCLDEENGFLPAETISELKKILTANGRSFSNPIIVDGVVDKDASRRVEFNFRLKSDEMMEEMKSILSDDESGQ